MSVAVKITKIGSLIGRERLAMNLKKVMYDKNVLFLAPCEKIETRGRLLSSRRV